MTMLTAHLTPDAGIAVAAAFSATFASVLQIWQTQYLLKRRSTNGMEEKGVDGEEGRDVGEGEFDHMTHLLKYSGGVLDLICASRM
jgi:hypothetical protein